MPVHKTMRITGGRLVRRRFLIPELVDENVVRPTPDRVREAVFSMIQADLVDAVVLDLFAGSGAHGFEALSRGAKAVSFVERDHRIAQVIKNNIDSLDLGEQCRLIVQDVREFIKIKPYQLASIIFVDPPYSLVLDADFFSCLLQHMTADALIIFRCFKKEKLDLGNSLSIERDRVYGGTRVLILRRADQSLTQG